MIEPVEGIIFGDVADGIDDGLVESFNTTSSSRTQELLKLRPTQLNRAKDGDIDYDTVGEFGKRLGKVS